MTAAPSYLGAFVDSYVEAQNVALLSVHADIERTADPAEQAHLTELFVRMRKRSAELQTPAGRAALSEQLVVASLLSDAPLPGQ